MSPKHSPLSVLIGGWLVDRIGVRAVVIPGLFLLAFANWQLSFLSLTSPYQWLQVILVLRGFSLGLVSQPLILAALATIRPQLLTQASTISTVVRSLGIAVLATVVQTQTQVHYAHLAGQVTPASSLGQLVGCLQAYLVARGTDLATAKTTVLQLIARLLEQQSYMLAIRDAFLLTLAFVFLSVIATLFLQGKQKMLESSPQSVEPVTGDSEAEAGAVEKETALAGVS